MRQGWARPVLAGSNLVECETLMKEPLSAEMIYTRFDSARWSWRP